MTLTKWTVALLAATALTGIAAAPAFAAQDAAAADAPVTAEEAAAQLEFLHAQVDAMQAQLDAIKKQTADNTPTWSGMPQFKATGFSFKPNGEIQYDAAYTGNPNNAIATPNLGFNNRARRLLFGASGDLPGGFKYAFQFDFNQATINYEDVVFSYEPAGKPYTVSVGYFYPYNSLDNLTSNRFVSVVERNQAVDAFGQGRRLGIGFGYVAGDLRLSAGAFANQINNANFDNNDWELAGRILYAPQMFGGQLHFAVNGEYRRFRTTSLGIQYRARPFTQVTDQRFVDAGAIAAKGDFVVGLEALGIFGPLHAQGEAEVRQDRRLSPRCLDRQRRDRFGRSVERHVARQQSIVLQRLRRSRLLADRRDARLPQRQDRPHQDPQRLR